MSEHVDPTDIREQHPLNRGEVVLMSVGVVLDGGLVASVPPDEWTEYAARAVSADQLVECGLVTLPIEQWESADASEVLAVASGAAGLLAAVGEYGDRAFTSLNSESREALRQAAQQIEAVTKLLHVVMSN